MGSWTTAGDRVQAVPDHLDALVEVGAGPVHLVDEADPGDLVLVGLAPHRLGLGLDPGHGVEHGHRAVEHPQGALHLDGEVDVARGVDDVDHRVPPHAGGGGRGDGDAPLLLLDHPVHGGGALVDLADLVVLARVVQDPLGGGGLARVDVGHDPDVAGLGQWDGGECVLQPWLISSRVVLVGGARCRGAGRRGPSLPAVVGEGLVGLRHLVEVLTALGRGPDAVGRVADLVGQALGHRLLAALLRVADQPPDGQGGGPAGPDLDRDLVGGATDPAAPDLELGTGVLHGLLQHGHRVVAGLLGHVGQGVVDDALGQGALAPAQHPVDHLGDQHRVVDGSGMSSRRTAGPLRGTSGLLLGAVAATGLIPLPDAGGVERAADHLVADAGEVLHPAAADQHDRVLLEVVALARDVGGHLEPAGQPDPGHLAEGRVRLLRGVGVDAGAHAPSLGRAPEGRGLRLRRLGRPTLADELGNRGHALPLRCGLQGYFRT